MTMLELLLPRWIVLKADEPPHGCLLRLAEANGLPDVATLQLMTGIKLSAVRNGRGLENLAELLHCDVSVIEKCATFYNGDTRTIVAGQLLRRRSDVSLAIRRVCPECMAESAHQRFWWDLQFMTSCPIHRVVLVDRCSCGNVLTWNDGSPTKCTKCRNGDVRSVSSSPAQEDIVAFDGWVLGRFAADADRPKSPIVEEMDLGDAVETVERIGSLVVGGYQDRWKQITDFEIPAEAVRAVGFRCIAEGQISDALDRAYEGFVQQNPDQLHAISRMYGWFFPWFRYNGGDRFSKELAGVLLANAAAKIQVTKRAFSLLLREETRITLSEAAKICRVRPGTLRKLLAAEDLIRDEKRKGAPISVRRDVAERIATDLQQSMTFTALGPFIGVSNTSLLKLVRSSTVPAWVMGGNHTKHRYLFRKSEVTDWLNRVIGPTPSVDRPPYGTAPIADAPLRCGIAMRVLIEAILAEKISVVAVLGDQRNLAGALLSVRAVAEYRRKIGPEAAQDPVQRYFRFQSPTPGGASNGPA
jgi:TniQ